MPSTNSYPAPSQATAFELTKYAFAVLFVYARLYLWSFHALRFFVNASHAVHDDCLSFSQKLTIIVFFSSLVVLTCLQLYWGEAGTSACFALRFIHPLLNHPTAPILYSQAASFSKRPPYYSEPS